MEDVISFDKEGSNCIITLSMKSDLKEMEDVFAAVFREGMNKLTHLQEIGLAPLEGNVIVKAVIQKPVNFERMIVEFCLSPTLGDERNKKKRGLRWPEIVFAIVFSAFIYYGLWKFLRYIHAVYIVK